MPEYSTNEIIRTSIEEHPAVKSWRVLRPGWVEPQGIEILHETKKSRVYRIAGVGLGGSAVVAKQYRYKNYTNALIERTIYEAVLPHLPLPRLHYYGLVQSDEEYYWLFLEDAGGEEYSPRIEEHRLIAARWLGIMQTSAARVAAASRLPDRGPSYYLARLQSVHAVIQRVLADFTPNTDDRLILESVVSQCDLLQAHWSELEQTCKSVPRTLVHGDFIGKNLRIRTSPSGSVLLPFDWETAGWGLPTIDLTTADLARFAEGSAEGSAASSASPEISVYRSIVSQLWPQFGSHDIAVLANLGMIFRLIDAVKWACEGLAEERSDERMQRSLGLLRFYEHGMARAMQAIKRGS